MKIGRATAVVQNRWLLRIPNGQKATPEDVALIAELEAAAAEGDGEAPKEIQTLPSPEIPEETLRKRKERHEKMQAESDERWAAKKRRRRTRDYAGIPADPPGPPRFPSETTLGESMDFLAMDSELYKETRAHFQRICEDMRIIKKTLAGTDKWATAKDRLKAENEHVASVFADSTNKDKKELALDVICTDVTKRMRTTDSRMTIVDAKNIIGVNPEESRQIRDSFYNILKHDHFTSKLETGPEHWEELKDQWIAKTPLLQSVMNIEQDPTLLNKKRKALEVLCRDVMKRLRDAQKKDGPTSVPPTPKPAAPRKEKTTTSAKTHTLAQQTAPQTAQIGLEYAGMQIDPSLLQEAIKEAPIGTTVASKPVAVYIKPHPGSTASIQNKDKKMLLSHLSTRTYAELQEVIRKKWSGSVISKIEGLAKTDNGGSIEFIVDGDEELDSYLDHVEGAKATFLVRLDRA